MGVPRGARLTRNDQGGRDGRPDPARGIGGGDIQISPECLYPLQPQIGNQGFAHERKGRFEAPKESGRPAQIRSTESDLRQDVVSEVELSNPGTSRQAGPVGQGDAQCQHRLKIDPLAPVEN